MLAAIGIAEPQSAESAFDEDNAAQDVGSTSKARFGPRDLREGKTSLTQYPKILHAEYPLTGLQHLKNVSGYKLGTYKNAKMLWHYIFDE
jgi:hypothetical protein